MDVNMIEVACALGVTSMQGVTSTITQYIQKEREFEYLIRTEKHTTLGNLGDMCFFESELAAIEDKIT